MDWIKINDQLPPDGQVVLTKVDHGNLVTNEQKLVRSGRLYFLEDRSMYVYYVPTHWMLINQNKS